MDLESVRQRISDLGAEVAAEQRRLARHAAGGAALDVDWYGGYSAVLLALFAAEGQIVAMQRHDTCDLN